MYSLVCKRKNNEFFHIALKIALFLTLKVVEFKHYYYEI